MTRAAASGRMMRHSLAAACERGSQIFVVAALAVWKAPCIVLQSAQRVVIAPCSGVPGRVGVDRKPLSVIVRDGPVDQPPLHAAARAARPRHRDGDERPQLLALAVRVRGWQALSKRNQKLNHGARMIARLVPKLTRAELEEFMDCLRNEQKKRRTR